MSEQASGPDEEIDLLDDDSKPDSRPARNGEKILIVDDEEEVRELLSTVLEMDNYQVLTASSSDVALKVISDHPNIKAVLVDYQMPKMNGLEFVKLIRQMKYLEGVPIVMVTGHSDVQFVKQGLSLGVKAWVVKPFDNIKLSETLEKVMS